MQSGVHDATSASPRALRLAAVAVAAVACIGWLSGCDPSPQPARSPAPAPVPQATTELATGATPGGPAAAPRVELKRGGPHGALEMPAQLGRMSSLVPDPPPMGPPQGVDVTFWALLVPKDNPLDAKRIALGKKLYFDERLSRDGTVACATCHDVSRGFTDRRNASEGVGGKVGRRNAPTTLNALFFQTQFWDGRSRTLEEQARLPIINPIEMGMPDEATAVQAIAGDAEYKEMFSAAYGRGPNMDDLARALASFERTLVFLDAPFDRFAAGDARAMSEDAKAGLVLFHGKGRCAGCHQFNGNNPIGTDNRFHNVGVSARHQDFEGLAVKALAALEKGADTQHEIDRLALETDLAELGRFVVTRNRADIGAFKTMQLRNVGITSPYMHDGSMQTLWDVMDHYNKGGEANRFLDGGMEPLALTEKEIDQLVAFMFALTDRHFADENEVEVRRQRALAQQKRPFRDDTLAQRKKFVFETRAGKPAAR